MKVHFTGIKGTGMASLAQILKSAGYEVQGSDVEKYIFTQDSLDQAGIPYHSFDEKMVDESDLVVAGLSFGENHPEIVEARKKGIPVYWYNDFLGKFMEDYTSVCIAGCHGKSTTTGMLAQIFAKAGPVGYLIGDGHGHLDEGSKVFLLEACEYKRHFLAYHPDYAIITNIELDHVDYYRDLKEYTHAFQQFVNQVKKGIIINGDDPELLKLHYPQDVIRFGLNRDCEYRIGPVLQDGDGLSYELFYGQKSSLISLPYNGMHYVYDSAAAFALAHTLGLKPELIAGALKEYRGIHRRFEIEEKGGSILIDDYAHHPTAIRMMIDAVRARYPDMPVVALFKPDRFSRIQYFLDGFAEALSAADQTVLFDFPGNAVREDESITVTIEDLQQKIPGARLRELDRQTAQELAGMGPAVFLFMSSKDIYYLRDMLMEELSGQVQDL